MKRDPRAELLAEALADFPTFCRGLVQILRKDGSRAFLEFNETQAHYNEHRSARDIVLKARQVGFTTLELARDVYKFITGHGERIVVVCQSIEGDAPLKKLSGDLQRMLDGLRFAGLELLLGNESARMWSLPQRDCTLQIITAGSSEAAAQKKGRAGTYTRVHATEVAFWEHPEMTLNALLEGVPNTPGTEIVFESTPNGFGNYFHRMFTSAEQHANGYRAHFFPWHLDKGYCEPLYPGEVINPETERERELAPLVTPEQLKWYRQKVESKGQDLVDQEYPSDAVRAFLQSGRTYFDTGRIAAMAGSVQPPLYDYDGEMVFADAMVGARYCVAVDPAEGLGEDGDWTSATVWERSTRRHVASLRARLQSVPFAARLVSLARRYNDATIVVERNKGMALIGALEALRYPHVYYDDVGKPGINTNVATRAAMLEELAAAIRDGSLRTSDTVMINEFRGFVTDPRTGKPYAPTKGKKNGTSDDSIFSAALAWRAMLRPDLRVFQVSGGRTPDDGLVGDSVGAWAGWGERGY